MIPMHVSYAEIVKRNSCSIGVLPCCAIRCDFEQCSSWNRDCHKLLWQCPSTRLLTFVLTDGQRETRMMNSCKGIRIVLREISDGLRLESHLEYGMDFPDMLFLCGRTCMSVLKRVKVAQPSSCSGETG